jgi:Oxidoreductase molybdopterin binding domain
LIGNAKWTGTPLLPFLEQAGIQTDAVEFAMRGADWYETTLPIKEVMRPEVRLVHRMNDESLTAQHGFPVRIMIPGHFGQKQPKWLVGIEAIARQKTGFWENQGWSNTAEIPTHSLVRQIQSTRVWNRQHQITLKDWRDGVAIAGVALDRSSSINAIAISPDNGQTWQQAEQNYPQSPHEWTLWRYNWKPISVGKYTILAKAKSQRQEQPLDDKNGKDGSSGILRVQVTLS